MSIKTEYPYASIKQCMEFATAVDQLGGSSSIEMCAEKLDKRVSGAFRDIISSAVKYGFVTAKRGGGVQLAQTYKDIKLSYSEREKKHHTQKAFLKIPLFRKVCDRLNNQKLPIEFFDKLLIKEFNVKESHAIKVKGLFIKGARDVGLLAADNTLCYDCESKKDESVECVDYKVITDNSISPEINKPEVSSDSYIVNIKGPGMNFTISIAEPDDIEVINVLLQNIEKKIRPKNEKE